MEISHVGCLNQKIHLDINDKIDSDFRLSETIDETHKTMIDCKSKIKNHATLRNLTDFSLITNNHTRWTSKFNILKQF